MIKVTDSMLVVKMNTFEQHPIDPKEYAILHQNFHPPCLTNTSLSISHEKVVCDQ